MMKKIFACLLLMCAMVVANAQEWTPLSAAASQKVQAQITQQVKQVKKMQSHFVQTKHSPLLAEDVVSKGKMNYTSPDMLRWEYTSPYSYAMQIKGDSITTLRDGVAQANSATQRRMMKGMMKMILGISSGNNLFDAKSFTTTLYQSKTRYRAVLVPKSKNLQRMFSQIELIFDQSSSQVRQIILYEGNQSQTTIEFTDISVQ